MSKTSWNFTRSKGHGAVINKSIGKCLPMCSCQLQSINLLITKLDTTIAITKEKTIFIRTNCCGKRFGCHKKKGGLRVYVKGTSNYRKKYFRQEKAVASASWVNKSLLTTKKVSPEIRANPIPNRSLDTLECCEKCRIMWGESPKTLGAT